MNFRVGFSDDLHEEVSHDFSSRKRKIVGEITDILYQLNDIRPYIKSILSCESGEMFMEYFKEYLVQLFSGEHDKHSSCAPQEYMPDHMVCDFAETVCWWMKHEQYSAEGVSRFFFAVSPF